MNTNKAVIVGSSSDLLQPLLQGCKDNGIELLRLNRSEWDLSQTTPNRGLIRSIVEFSPDHIVYAAGQNTLTDIHGAPPDVVSAIKQHMAVNCLSFVSIVLELMKELSQTIRSVHALSSLYGLYGRRARIPYSISKHALEGAIKCLAVEFPGTQFIGYRPGFFDTKLTSQNIPASQRPSLEARVPLHRFGHPEELSSLILANLLNPVPYFTGICLTVDGGMTAGGLFDQ
jgi:NAD(P)-dependent dehydrogenase (short-subunit alcohol dehydrogenase family)